MNRLATSVAEAAAVGAARQLAGPDARVELLGEKLVSTAVTTAVACLRHRAADGRGPPGFDRNCGILRNGMAR